MKQSQYRVGILAKIFFALAFGVLMAVVILATVLFLFMRQITDASVQDSVNVSTESNCQKLNTLIDRIRVASELIGSNEEIYVVPANGSMTPIKEMIMYDAPGENNETLRALVNDIVQNTTTFNSNFYSCFGHDGGAYVNKLFVATEFTVSRYLNKHQKLSDSGCGLYSAKSVENEAWYRETVRRDGEEYWFVQPDDPGYLCMARAITCNMLEGGQLKQYQLGVLALRFDISWVSDRIQVSTMTKDGKVLLTDPDGAVIYATSGAEYLDAETVRALPEEGASEQSYMGRTCRIQKTMLDNRLMLVTIVPLADLQALTVNALRITLLVSMIVLAMTLIASFLVARRVTTPLRRLSNHMARGTLDTIACANVGNDEIGTLYDAFNRLMQQLKDTIQTAITESERKKVAELHALQAQINPHFVYNTLNSAACLALLRRQDDIAEVLSDLTNLMRYNTKETDKLVPLSEEIRLLRAYERIEHCCYRGALAVQYSVSPDAQQVCVPKMILQPLVENAILHGVDFRKNDVNIRITGGLSAGRLWVEVWDNGVDADVDAINRILQSEEDPTQSKSIGIRNVYTRLRMTYGEGASLEFRHDEARHTVAHIEVPLMTETEPTTKSPGIPHERASEAPFAGVLPTDRW